MSCAEQKGYYLPLAIVVSLLFADEDLHGDDDDSSDDAATHKHHAMSVTTRRRRNAQKCEKRERAFFLAFVESINEENLVKDGNTRGSGFYVLAINVTQLFSQP